MKLATTTWTTTLVLALLAARAAHADETAPAPPAVPTPEAVRAEPTAPAAGGDQATPRLKLSYQRFSAGNVDGTAMPLQALHLDMYALSWNVLRAGVSVEGGRGQGALAGQTAAVKYGLLGASAGLQWPGPLTPFIEGTFAGGVLAATLDGPLTIPGTSITMNGASAATWMYTRGIDAGVEIYTIGRAYLSLSVGWLRTTWGSADYQAMLTNNVGAGLSFKDVTRDSFLFKVGLGI